MYFSNAFVLTKISDIWYNFLIFYKISIESVSLR